LEKGFSVYQADDIELEKFCLEDEDTFIDYRLVFLNLVDELVIARCNEFDEAIYLLTEKKHVEMFHKN
jgi:hypothetical protein